MKKMSLGTRKTKWSKLKFTGESQRKNDLFIVKVYCIVSFANSHVEVLWYITSFWRRSRKFPLTSSNLIWVEYCTLSQFNFLLVLLPILVFGNFETRTQFWQMLSIIAKYIWYLCLDHMARISCLLSRRRGWSRCGARPWPTSCSPTPSSWSCSSSSPTPTETQTHSRSKTI